MKTKFIILFLIILLFSATNASSYECTGEIYDEPSMVEPTYNLSIYKTIYLKIVCNGLPEDKHIINVDWVNPHNKVARHDQQAFMVNAQDVRVIYFWLKLMKKGPIERNLTNADFDRENYGVWKVFCYLDDALIFINKFKLY